MPQDLSTLDHFLLESLQSLFHVGGHVDENACVHERDLGHGGGCGCGLHVTKGEKAVTLRDPVQLGDWNGSDLR